MASNLVIVESPSKAKTLKKYLGHDFEILATYGHVRDLEAKEGAVDPDRDFRMRYVPIDRNRRHMEAIAKALSKAHQVYLATDPDREGEAIAWHVRELLDARKLLKGKRLRRVVFYEITESAVKEAIAHPRDIAMPLVNAQQARRALDHLVGFNLSPLLWKKIGPSLSAGRVQSPALRLIVEREQEIEAFKPREYWTIHLDTCKGQQRFQARLVQLRGKKLAQFSIPSEEVQNGIVTDLIQRASGEARVVKVETKPRQRQAAAPFTTSTLQQEAVRKLSMSTDRAMRVAQQLYEGVDIGTGNVGLITYMRTDSVNLANEAIAEIRRYIGQHFDADYLPQSPVRYRSKSINAQEAHEAIRPTSIFRTPESLRGHLTSEQLRLYEMVWKRTLASQIAPAQFEGTTVEISVADRDTLFRANGQVLVFPGFMAVYLEDADDAEEVDEQRLPVLKDGEMLPAERIFGEQHFTQPPPRYTEASLVKTLEEYGIGRPSTYANIISTLIERAYAYLDKKRFAPTEMGRLVNAFLTAHFDPYVAYGFTAELENELDEISNDQRQWQPVLRDFWGEFSRTLGEKQEVPRGAPLDETCPKCSSALYLQTSKRGLFVGCSGYPECDYTRPWGALAEGPRSLGNDPTTGARILLLRGPYGYYVQLGETEAGAKRKPKRAAWPKNVPVETASLDLALKLLSLPRVLGNHPDTGKPIEASIGPFGPYIKHDGAFRSIPKADSVFSVDLARAVQILAEPKGKGAARREIGAHPGDGKPVSVGSGRFGPYVKHGKTYASIPKAHNPDAITLEQAVALLDAKAAKGDAKKGPRGTQKKVA